MRRLILLGALSTLNFFGALAQDPPAPVLECVTNCISSSRNIFVDLGCTNAADAACLCAKDNFRNSVQDCSAAPGCDIPQEQALAQLVGTFCKDFPPQETKASKTTTVETSTQQLPTSTTNPAATSTTNSTTVESKSSQSTTTASSTPAANSSTTTPASDVPAATNTSTADDQSPEKDAEGTPAKSSSGLSQGAAVGIGVGVTFIVIVIAVAAMAVIIQKKRNRRSAEVASDISRPMPGSGRYYNPSMDNGSYVEKRGGESIEMTSNRYEDMPPRQTPRTMV